jgi:hypothetical protein
MGLELLVKSGSKSLRTNLREKEKILVIKRRNKEKRLSDISLSWYSKVLRLILRVLSLIK